ncbi:MAG TPA: DNA primase large subunit PriL [Candidatus Saccharimonadales bacterium]|nr:DNA primase large subunit PriL [Candidatus Saccharimonadales bacterium]
MQTLLTKLDYAKYPFTVEALAYIRARNIDPTELTRTDFLPILDRAIDRIRQAVFSGKISPEITQEDVDIIAYPTALMLISATGDDRSRRRYALAEAKRAYELLRAEPPEKLLQIAIFTFSWDARLVEQRIGESYFEFAVHFRDYIRNSTRMRDLRWKLVNRVVSQGYVFLPREDFSRLLEEEVQARILEKTSDFEIVLPEDLARYVAPLVSSLKARSTALATDDMPRVIVPAAMPPCMKNLLSMLQTSKHISHMGRFAMAAFLLNIGTDEQDLLNMLKSFTDFDERLARYQVEHIAGKRGSRRKYTAPNCTTMQMHGLCVNPDEVCATIRHPLSYYRRKARSAYLKKTLRNRPTMTGNKQ